MKKLRIFSICNDGRFNYFIVEKNKNFFIWLSKVLSNSFGYISGVEKQEYVNKKDNFVSKKKNIKDYNDGHEHYMVKGGRIDVFFGKNKAFITLNTSLDNRKKFVNSLDKFSVFINPKKKG